MNGYKRKTTLFILVFIAVFSPFLFSCSSLRETDFIKGVKENLKNQFDILTDFSVMCLDVGESDCTFVRFPDGKNMLIDCGDNTERSKTAIDSTLKGYSVGKIDYLVLSSPNQNKIGCAKYVLDNYAVVKAFVPKIINKTYFGFFESVTQQLTDKKVETVFTTKNLVETGENYGLAFLSPTSDEIASLNGTVSPSESILDAVAPVIYITCYGRRFVIGTNARISSEETIVTDYSVQKFILSRLGIDFNLESIDFYKASKNGDYTANGEKLLNLLSPSYCLISSGAEGYYSHPSTSTLSRIVSANPSTEILRTDQKGSVFVGVSKNGDIRVITQSEL